MIFYVEFWREDEESACTVDKKRNSTYAHNPFQNNISHHILPRPKRGDEGGHNTRWNLTTDPGWVARRRGRPPGWVPAYRSGGREPLTSPKTVTQPPPARRLRVTHSGLFTGTWSCQCPATWTRASLGRGWPGAARRRCATLWNQGRRRDAASAGESLFGFDYLNRIIMRIIWSSWTSNLNLNSSYLIIFLVIFRRLLWQWLGNFDSDLDSS